jgi:hypothetical protein
MKSDVEAVYVSGVMVGLVALRESDYYLTVERLFIAPPYRTSDVAHCFADFLWAKALQKRKPVKLHIAFASNTRRFWETVGYVVSEATTFGFNMVRRLPAC